jgi:eukaryotic-like serine/threonine-protein kinase
MTPEQHEKVCALFDEVLKVPPAERACFLDRVCADSPWLRAEIEKWLANLQQAEQAGFLDPPTRRTNPEAVASAGPVAFPSAPPHIVSEPAHPAKVPGPPPEFAQSYADFIRDLLHQRLRLVAIIASFLFGLFLAKDIVTGGYPLDQPRSDFLVHAGITLVICMVAVLLWSRRSLGILWLRGVEFLVVGLNVVFLLQYQVLLLRVAPEWAAHSHEDVLLAVGDSISLRWFATLVIYGLYVPNTLARCLAMVAGMAATPLIVVVALAAWEGIPGLFVETLIDLTVWLLVGSVLAVYGSYKIAMARQEMFQGRKLGKYKLKERIGKGGMGEVWLADDSWLRRPCALKVIGPERAGDATVLRRFQREVRATARLFHENIVSIYDYGNAADGTFYYVMEYVPGLDLRELVVRHGPLSSGRTIHFLKQAAAALQEAHAAGLIHRDVKPKNMIACSRPPNCDQLKLVDFGLVRDTQALAAGESRTHAGIVFGTPSFMSPEQVDPTPVLDGRSDIYSLGAVAYFLLTGRPPFLGKDVEVLAAHLNEPAIPPSRLCPHIQADLERVVLRCLEKDPAQRFQAAAEVIAGLSACACGTAWTNRHAAEWWSAKESETIAVVGPRRSTGADD